jgi:A/G-specific adenine glycosylase
MRAEALTEISAVYDDLPNDPEKLEELTRVGPYVANATTCIAESRVLPLLDRNIKRVYTRVFADGFPDGEREQLEFVSRMLPDDGATARTYNLALVDFGALVCTKRGPECETCFASDYCDYYRTEVRP